MYPPYWVSSKEGTFHYGICFICLFYQGTLTLLSSFIGPFVTDAVAQEISAAGGILIFGIGLTMSKIIAMRVGNMIPGLFIVAVMTYFFG